jgi:hypothetical protein
MATGRRPFLVIEPRAPFSASSRAFLPLEASGARGRPSCEFRPPPPWCWGTRPQLSHRPVKNKTSG